MMANDEVITNLKILIIGEAGVGKSCLLLRFAEDTFDDGLISTIGFDHKAKTIRVFDQNVRLSLWDTAGSERFRTLTASFYRGAQGAILVYDVACRDSFLRLDSWLTEVDSYSTHGNMIRMLVGNKVDKENERQVTKQEGIAYARKHQMLFVEASAKTSENVVCCFEELVAKIIHTPGLWERQSPSTSGHIRLGDQDEDEEWERNSYCQYC